MTKLQTGFRVRATVFVAADAFDIAAITKAQSAIERVKALIAKEAGLESFDVKPGRARAQNV